MKPKRVALAASLVIWAGAASVAMAQSNLGQLRDAPSAKFTPQDFEMFWAAVDEVSQSRKPGTLKSWKNAATGNGGSLKLLEAFKSTEDRECRRLRVDNHTRTLKGSTTQIVCAGRDGRWLLDADAKPAAEKETEDRSFSTGSSR